MHVRAGGAHLCGARELDIAFATGPFIHCRKDGSVMISGSEKRLYRKGSTSSSESGPPRFSSSTPSGAACGTPSPGTADESPVGFISSTISGEERPHARRQAQRGATAAGVHAPWVGAATAHNSAARSASPCRIEPLPLQALPPLDVSLVVVAVSAQVRLR